jgi:hypothetical protein
MSIGSHTILEDFSITPSSNETLSNYENETLTRSDKSVQQNLVTSSHIDEAI